MAAATAEFGSTVGGRAWRYLLRRLQEMEGLFGAISSQIGPSQRVSACIVPFNFCTIMLIEIYCFSVLIVSDSLKISWFLMRNEYTFLSLNQIL